MKDLVSGGIQPAAGRPSVAHIINSMGHDQQFFQKGNIIELSQIGGVRGHHTL